VPYSWLSTAGGRCGEAQALAAFAAACQPALGTAHAAGFAASLLAASARPNGFLAAADGVQLALLPAAGGAGGGPRLAIALQPGVCEDFARYLLHALATAPTGWRGRLAAPGCALRLRGYDGPLVDWPGPAGAAGDRALAAVLLGSPCAAAAPPRGQDPGVMPAPAEWQQARELTVRGGAGPGLRLRVGLRAEVPDELLLLALDALGSDERALGDEVRVPISQLDLDIGFGPAGPAGPSGGLADVEAADGVLGNEGTGVDAEEDDEVLLGDRDEEDEDKDDDEGEEEDEDGGSALQRPWDSLDEEEQEAAQALGYRGGVDWPAPPPAPWPAAFDRLSDAQQELFAVLGVDEYAWSPPSPAAADAGLRPLFDALDTDGDGAVDRSELATALAARPAELIGLVARLEANPSFDPGRSLFAQLDLDRDGSVSFAEFATAFGS
jgi:hypothetical protein